ncbi:MAG: hypothetical protein OEZ13_03190 [Spirochaetia bacterium]|nr:hypothetical protein [Spirochaetia bacterium]
MKNIKIITFLFLLILLTFNNKIYSDNESETINNIIKKEKSLKGYKINTINSYDEEDKKWIRYHKGKFILKYDLNKNSILEYFVSLTDGQKSALLIIENINDLKKLKSRIFFYKAEKFILYKDKNFDDEIVVCFKLGSDLMGFIKYKKSGYYLEPYSSEE